MSEDRPNNQDAETLNVDDVETAEVFPASPGVNQGSSTGPTSMPKKIGGYSIKKVIASGGMGTVYLAQQKSPRRVVALKVMKSGLASKSALRRFEYESQILARLKHPNIAQVYEAGTHDDGEGGVPFFAMEYIANAKPITEYAQARKLSTKACLELFIKVCDAVHHGHQKGIIHRDLKPGNILVDRNGEPKIIDFGVARATDSDMAITTLQTNIGQLIGTLQYMSPEQCDADPHDLDTRSDVYALGVVLYELVTEQLPYDVSAVALHEAARVIQEQDPAKPSTVKRTLRGDIETITLKAIEKDRDRRYKSAESLGDDINRHLRNEPIEARPAGAIYRLRKFAVRNKSVTAVAIAMILMLVTTTVISLISMSYMITSQESVVEQFDVLDSKMRFAQTAMDESSVLRQELYMWEELVGVAIDESKHLGVIGTVNNFIGIWRGSITIVEFRNDSESQHSTEGRKILSVLSRRVANNDWSNLQLTHDVDQDEIQLYARIILASSYYSSRDFEAAIPYAREIFDAQHKELQDIVVPKGEKPYMLEDWYAAGVDIFTLLIEAGRHDEAVTVHSSLSSVFERLGQRIDGLTIMQSQLDMVRGDSSAAWGSISKCLAEAIITADDHHDAARYLSNLGGQEKSRKSYATASILFACAIRMYESLGELRPFNSSLFGLTEIIERYEKARMNGHDGDARWQTLCMIAQDLNRLDEMLGLDLPPPGPETQEILTRFKTLCVPPGSP